MKTRWLFFAVSIAFVFLLSSVACNDSDAPWQPLPYASDAPWQPLPYATVTSAQLEVDNANFSGTCPHTFKFTGTITTSDAGRVFYDISGAGEIGDRGTVIFSSPGSQTVAGEETWHISGADSYYLEIESQNGFRSAPVSVTCQ